MSYRVADLLKLNTLYQVEHQQSGYVGAMLLHDSSPGPLCGAGWRKRLVCTLHTDSLYRSQYHVCCSQRDMDCHGLDGLRHAGVCCAAGRLCRRQRAQSCECEWLVELLVQHCVAGAGDSALLRPAALNHLPIESLAAVQQGDQESKRLARRIIYHINVLWISCGAQLSRRT